MQDGKLNFDGLIKWQKGSNIITWSDDEGQRTAIFGPEGTMESRGMCRRVLMEDWMKRRPSRTAQWILIKDDFMLLWEALEKAFGNPKIDDI